MTGTILKRCINYKEAKNIKEETLRLLSQILKGFGIPEIENKPLCHIINPKPETIDQFSELLMTKTLAMRDALLEEFGSRWVPTKIYFSSQQILALQSGQIRADFPNRCERRHRRTEFTNISLDYLRGI